MVTVSWVLPVYNGARYLREAVESVLQQTYEDFELIIVDDGSTDQTPALLERFAAEDRRVAPLLVKHGGIVAALNAGLQRSAGRYVARMDADDICTPDRLRRQVEFLDAHPGSVLVGGEAQEIYDDGRIGRLTTGGRHRVTNLNAFPPKVAVSVHPLILVRREALQAVGGYRNHFPHAEDYDLFLRLGRVGALDNPPGVILRYRRHEEAVSLLNLDLQERSAALAEACAIHESRHGPIKAGDDVDAICLSVWPKWLLEPYIRFRIWRRINGLPERPPGWSAWSIAPVLLSLSPPALLSLRYWTLRVRIAGYFVKSLSERRPVPTAPTAVRPQPG